MLGNQGIQSTCQLVADLSGLKDQPKTEMGHMVVNNGLCTVLIFFLLFYYYFND